MWWHCQSAQIHSAAQRHVMVLRICTDPFCRRLRHVNVLKICTHSFCRQLRDMWWNWESAQIHSVGSSETRLYWESAQIHSADSSDMWPYWKSAHIHSAGSSETCDGIENLHRSILQAAQRCDGNENLHRSILQAAQRRDGTENLQIHSAGSSETCHSTENLHRSILPAAQRHVMVLRKSTDPLILQRKKKKKKKKRCRQLRAALQTVGIQLNRQKHIPLSMNSQRLDQTKHLLEHDTIKQTIHKDWWQGIIQSITSISKTDWQCQEQIQHLISPAHRTGEKQAS